ncbi:MAG: hypothetical protein MJY57_03495 [Bacteroidales bacterium]|nr:hypothetical protein [Bacteroidales bacterium]
MRKHILIFAGLLASALLGATDFKSLRTKSQTLPEGTVIEGIVVSDWHSENTELNPNLEWDRVDISLSHKTAYIESVDGQYGLRLVFDAQYFNRLERGSLVSIDLSGCTLTAEKNPERYTVSGILGGKVTLKKASVPIPVKERTIAELKDEDIYTQVRLGGVEFLSKQGSFSNIYEKCTTETPINRTLVDIHYHAADGWAQLLEDGNGDNIYLQVNSKCQWRRNNIGVPKGIGCVNAVVVTGDNRRYGGSFGSYSLRPMVREDIDIPMEPASSFSPIVSWRWDRNYDGKLHFRDAGEMRWMGATKEKAVCGDVLLPESGNGTLTLTNNCGMKLCNEYDGRHCTDANGIGARKQAALLIEGKCSEWIRGNGNGALLIETSTKGVSGKGLVFNFSLLGGKGTFTSACDLPSFWTVEWSTDGSKFQPTGFKTRIRPLAWEGTDNGKSGYAPTSYDCAMGFSEYSIKLPASLLGAEKLYIRIIPVGDSVTEVSTDAVDDINSIKRGGNAGETAVKFGMIELKAY